MTLNDAALYPEPFADGRTARLAGMIRQPPEGASAGYKRVWLQSYDAAQAAIVELDQWKRAHAAEPGPCWYR